MYRKVYPGEYTNTDLAVFYTSTYRDHNQDFDEQVDTVVKKINEYL
jgi:hypothetical protein